MVTYDCINLQLKNKNMVAKQLLPESLQNNGKDHFCIKKNEQSNSTKTYEKATKFPDITYSEGSKTQPFFSTSSMYVALWF